MPDIQIPGIVISVLEVVLAFTGAFAVALWLSLIVWTFRDARSRSRDAFAILLATLMTVIFGPLGVLLYFLLRPQVTLAELYERSLEEEALLQDLEERDRCPGCSRVVESDWVVCPDCHTRLKDTCTQCGHVLHLRWTVCPYCGTPTEAHPPAQMPDELLEHDDHSHVSPPKPAVLKPVEPPEVVPETIADAAPDASESTAAE